MKTKVTSDTSSHSVRSIVALLASFLLLAPAARAADQLTVNVSIPITATAGPLVDSRASAGRGVQTTRDALADYGHLAVRVDEQVTSGAFVGNQAANTGGAATFSADYIFQGPAPTVPVSMNLDLDGRWTLTNCSLPSACGYELDIFTSPFGLGGIHGANGSKDPRGFLAPHADAFTFSGAPIHVQLTTNEANRRSGQDRGHAQHRHGRRGRPHD